MKNKVLSKGDLVWVDSPSYKGVGTFHHYWTKADIGFNQNQCFIQTASKEIKVFPIYLVKKYSFKK